MTGSGAGSFCFLWGWRLLLVGRYPPACCSSRLPQSFFYGFYKKLTELSANNFRLLFCWPGWSPATSLSSSAVTSWRGSSGDKSASPHPRSRLTQLPLCPTRPGAFVRYKTHCS